MPFIRFKGVEREVVESIAPTLIERFAQIAQIKQEIVKLELLKVEAIVNSPISVEIMMFPREQEKHDEIAALIHYLLGEHGITRAHIFFILLSPSLYYKEGRPIVQPINLTSK